MINNVNIEGLKVINVGTLTPSYADVVRSTDGIVASQ